MREQDIAVVGMGLRVPGAVSLDQFWSQVSKGRDCLTRASKGALERAGVSARRINEDGSVAAKPLLADFKSFDAKFFGISDIQAQWLDPTHRLFLECVWEVYVKH